jgi:PST family polysaccharide transporter
MTDREARIERAYLKQAVLRGGLAKLGAQAANVLVRLGTLMLFARLLEPADFGLVGMVAAILGVVGLLKDFGLSAATVQRASVSEIQLSALFWLNLLFGCILWLICFALAPVLVAFYKEPRLFWVTVALAAGLFFTAASVQHTALLQRQMRFGVLATIEVLSLLGGTAIGLWMANSGMGYWALVGWSIALPAGNCVGVWLATGWLPGLPRRGANVLPMLRFGGLVTLNILVVQIGYNLEKILLGRYWGAETLGFYGRAYQLTSMATDNLLGTIGSVAFPALSRAHGNAGQFENYFVKGYKLVLTMALPISLFCLLFAEQIVLVLLGPKWVEVAPTFRLLSPLIFILALINPLGWLLYSLGMVGRSLKVALAIVPLVTIGYVAGLPYGANGVAAGYTLAMALWIVPHVVWCTKGTSLSLSQLLSVARTPCVAGALAAAAAYLAGILLRDIPPLAALTVGGTVLAGVYLWALLWLLGEKSFYMSLIESLHTANRAHQQRGPARG